MKTIAFYNEKGGVGKTSFTIMYASYLYYKHGIDIAVVDLNNRLNGYRAKEIKEKTINGTIENFNLDHAWPIVAPQKGELKKYRTQLFPESLWFNEHIRAGELKGKKVVLIDLPGAAGGDTNVASMIHGQHIGMYVIPTERNIQTARATVGVFNTINKYSNYDPVIVSFINRTFIPNVSRDKYQGIADKYKELKIPVLPDMVSNSSRMDNISAKSIICSTLEYPDWDNEAFKGSRDLGIENLFIDITRLLNTSREHPGTNTVVIDFADDMQKQFREDRQLRNTMFPQFEFPETMFKAAKADNNNQL